MKSKMTTVLLSVLAANQTTKKIVEEIRNALDNWEKSDFKDKQAEDKVFSEMAILLLKIQQGNLSPMEAMEKAMDMSKKLDKVLALEEEENVIIEPITKKEKTPPEDIIFMGDGGDA